MAGESAREHARRQRDKAARSMRAAERWERGAEGEEATAAVLRALPVEDWTVLHDVRWPGRKLANIDHVAVGPGGVFVIDSKNWRIEVRDGVLRQNGYSREAAVASVAEAAIAVSLLAPYVESQLAVPVLCFTRDEPVAGWARDVMVCSTANLAELLVTRPPRLDPLQRQQICLGLDLGLAAATRPQGTGGTHPDPPSTASPPRRSPRRPVQPSRPARPSRGRGRAPRRGPGGQLLRFLVAAALLLWVVGSGILPALGQRVGEIVTEQVTPEQAEPAPGRKRDPKPKRQHVNPQPTTNRR